MHYKHFDPVAIAERSLNYLTRMTDPANDHLPYWLILPNKKPAEAAHCRVDDAELVASWYEGLDATRKILATDRGGDVLASFRRFLLSSWGPKGLRYHRKYPWTHTMHSSFHEMGYVLSAMNRLCANDPSDAEAEKRTAALVRGMRSLAIERKVRTFWSGDFAEPDPVYEFPNDVYLLDGGFDTTRHTGRGEQCIRNAVVLEGLVDRWFAAGDEVALDLARGIANHLLGPARYFNWKMEFMGHVHSTVWVAVGLAKLHRATGDAKYLSAAKGIYDYARSLSSSFGWVPEYAQWHPMAEEHCETCCIKDMLVLARELVRCGHPEYWNDFDLFARNQFAENQIDSATYVVCDESLPDSADGSITHHDIGGRMIGGFTGGSLPNSISINKFRSIAGCCCGTAPQALQVVWDCAVEKENGVWTVNVPLDRETAAWKLVSRYPDEGSMAITLKRGGRAGFRRYKWMGRAPRGFVDGAEVALEENNGVLLFPRLKPGQTAELRHPIRTAVRPERVAGKTYRISWRGPDVVDVFPRGEHLRLFQRDLDRKPYLPKPSDVTNETASNYGPTQQTKAPSGAPGGEVKSAAKGKPAKARAKRTPAKAKAKPAKAKAAKRG